MQTNVVLSQHSLSKIEDLYLKLFKVRVLSHDTNVASDNWRVENSTEAETNCDAGSVLMLQVPVRPESR